MAVDIYERVDSELSGRGAGIVAEQELIERLRGRICHQRSRRPYHQRKIIDAQGRLTEEIECPQVLTAWERVSSALVKALQQHEDVESALKRFEEARLPENYRIFERARRLGAYLRRRERKKSRRAGLHSTDAAVIAETAVLDFLYV